MTGKTIAAADLKPMDAFRSGGYEYVFLGRETCWNKNINAVQYMDGCVEVEYIGNMELSPYIPPDWCNLICPSDVDYDALIENLDIAQIEWQPHPRGLFPRKVVQVKEDRYQEAQRLMDMTRLHNNGPFAPGTK